ncbi:uncharacterized protein LOC141573199 isoform X2 [Rhinolophus sinicus]|uniref:uncharacterized protein LOC141573199 isoform X2 n=1 Tax=Rhinolophus sinicus TaxID=89399 RepID=UPI003D79C42B
MITERGSPHLSVGVVFPPSVPVLPGGDSTFTTCPGNQKHPKAPGQSQEEKERWDTERSETLPEDRRGENTADFYLQKPPAPAS